MTVDGYCEVKVVVNKTADFSDFFLYFLGFSFCRIFKKDGNCHTPQAIRKINDPNIINRAPNGPGFMRYSSPRFQMGR